MLDVLFPVLQLLTSPRDGTDLEVAGEATKY